MPWTTMTASTLIQILRSMPGDTPVYLEGRDEVYPIEYGLSLPAEPADGVFVPHMMHQMQYPCFLLRQTKEGEW